MTKGTKVMENRDSGLNPPMNDTGEDEDEIENLSGRITDASDRLAALTIAVKAIIRVLNDIAPATRATVIEIMEDEVARLDRFDELSPATNEWTATRREGERGALTDLIVAIETD
jgi:hypothetical protein